MFRNIPKVDKILEWPEIKGALQHNPRMVVLDAITTALDAMRREIGLGIPSLDVLDKSAIAARIMAQLASLTTPSLRRVINGTGVIMHTNLGRAPLAESLRDRLLQTAFAYSNLEFDLKEGSRGSRNAHLEPLICRLTGAEAALAVNNNAAAVLLALSATASGKEVIVSRGELVEIGGSFRIPDIMGLSGAVLREVGTTNRTHASDYSQAICPETALLLKVHRSNFSVVGFTANTGLAELVKIGHETGVPVMADMGSGNLFDFSSLGIECEPTVRDYVKAGVDLVTFSGDKLLGGPQAGIIVGKKAFVEPLRKHPFTRAVRIDKLTLAALEGTLRLYLDDRSAREHIPTISMLTADMEALNLRARRLSRIIRRELRDSAGTKVLSGFSQAGGGSLPLVDLPTKLLAISLTGFSANSLESSLRNGTVPVLGLIRNDLFQLDMRTLFDRDLPEIVSALISLSRSANSTSSSPAVSPPP